jgi:hypothetical protein
VPIGVVGLQEGVDEFLDSWGFGVAVVGRVLLGLECGPRLGKSDDVLNAVALRRSGWRCGAHRWLHAAVSDHAGGRLPLVPAAITTPWSLYSTGQRYLGAA